MKTELKTELEIGVFDDSENSCQPIFTVNLLKNNIAIYGSSMSGKTTFLKTLIVRLHQKLAYNEEIYIIDFGGSLNKWAECDKVYAYFDSSNEENIKRVFRVIEDKIKENTDKLNGRNYIETLGTDDCPNHITLIIDNVNAFLSEERYANYKEKLLKFSRDGLSKGLTIVYTANSTKDTGELLFNFELKLAFDMPKDSYSVIFNDKVISPIRVPGRFLFDRNGSVYECQCFLPFMPANDGTINDDGIQKLITKSKRESAGYKLRAFPKDLTFDSLKDNCQNVTQLQYALQAPNSVVVGLDYDDHTPVTLNYDENRVIAIYGKRQNGKSNLLRLILNDIINKDKDCKLILFDDGRKELEEFISVEQTEKYFTKEEEVKAFIEDNYTGRNADKAEKPRRIFVFQNKAIYRNTTGTVSGSIQYMFPKIIPYANQINAIFIFADVKPIADYSYATEMNCYFQVVFLLDNISEFVRDRGRRTVFGELDEKELKSEFARCSRGDGYVFSVEKDDMPKKLKFIRRDKPND